jgi:predicted metalloprotease
MKVGGGVAIVIALIVGVMGGDPIRTFLALTGGGQAPVETSAPVDSPEEAAEVDFVSVVLADTEDTWTPLFAQMQQSYAAPQLVLFRDGVTSACGFADTAVGPFYCPGDRRVYLDLSFFDELHNRFGAPGDFAQAYVIAHEVGHHVQTLTGVSSRVHQQQQRLGEAEANALSVRLELQADCYAGVWAHHAERSRDLLETGDIEEGLRAANAIGDDTLQRNAGRRVSPDSFTHGSAEQRQRWFQTGFDSGSVQACDTFAAAAL